MTEAFKRGELDIAHGIPLKLVDSFAPADWAAQNSTDSDLGSTSPVLVGGNRVFQIGKAGTGYLLDAGRLGGVGGQLSSAKVCSGPSLGGVSHTGTTLFVPCPGGVEAVDVTADRVVVRWASPVSTPGSRSRRSRCRHRFRRNRRGRYPRRAPPS